MSNIAFLENVVYWANIIVIIALALSLLGGGTSILFNRWLNTAKDTQSKIDKNIVDEKFSKMQIEVADARRKQAEAEKSLEEVRKRTLPRILTFEQRNMLIKLLKKDSELGDNIVIQSPLDDEPLGYANQLSEVFKEARWHDPNVSTRHLTKGNPKGINLVINDSNNTPPHALKIQNAFAKIGIAVKIIERDFGNDQTPILFVGPRE